MPIEHINKTDTLNEGREKLNNAITAFNETVVEGDSSVEAAQARVDEKGVPHPTLKARIDDGFEKTSQQLAQTDQQINNLEEEKANKQIVENELLSLTENKMDKNTTDISVNQINKNYGKLDETYMSESLLQQMAGNTPINSVPADMSVTPIKTTFITPGKNLFNKHEAVKGFHVKQENGELGASAQYYASSFIKIKPNRKYAIKTNHQYAFYDENKEYVSGDSGSNVIESPSDAMYLRVSVPVAYFDTYQVEENTEETSYEEFRYYLKTGEEVKVFAETENDSVGSKHIKNQSVSPYKTEFLVTGKNLFNKNARTLNKVLNSNSSVVSSSSVYDISDFIPVEELSEYVKTTDNNYVFYDNEYEYISGGSSSDKFTVPKGAKYVRLSIKKEDVDIYQLEKGSELTTFESFRYVFEKGKYDVDLKLHSEVPEKELACWFKADSINADEGNEIDFWEDSSLNGNDVISPSIENKPIYRVNEKGMPILEFTRNGNIEGSLGRKVLMTKNTRPVFDKSKGVSLFIVAKKFDQMEYEASFYETPFFVGYGTTESFIRTVIRNKFEVSTRRLREDSLKSLASDNIGLQRASHSLSLYETHIDFVNGKCVILQDGIEIARDDNFTTKGVTEEAFNSHVSIGDVASPPGDKKTGFSGEIGEVVLYRNIKSESDVIQTRNYLLNKWGIDKLDSRFYASYETFEFNESISESNKNLSLIGMKKTIDLTNKQLNVEGYLYLDEDAQKVYYSGGSYDKPNYLFDWDSNLTGEPCENYNPTITGDGDVVFMKLRDRGNPVVYPSGDYGNPVLIDFGGDEAPIAPLMDTGIEHDNDFFLSAEYWNPATSGEYQYIWKVEKPYTDKSNWTKVFQQMTQMSASPVVPGSIRHFHTLKRDLYNGNWYANTGDQNYQCKTFESTDDGETWTQVGGGAQSDRLLGLIFTEDGAYWGTDSHTDHALYFASRKEDGRVNFDKYKRLSWLSMMQPTYQTVLLRNPDGLLFLDRAEERLDYKLDLTFWSFEHKRLYRLDVIEAIDGDTGELDGRFGFPNQAVTQYQPITSDGVICGASSNWKSRPMSLKLLGNSLSNRINNLKIKVVEKE